mmetsp:Transcript_91419/g.293667  ORF Transcript_91419/g.293667 Transcript_91419/m.293667 type:complete len:213 (-) Transcript_91419:171-809(-)
MSTSLGTLWAATWQPRSPRELPKQGPRKSLAWRSRTRRHSGGGRRRGLGRRGMAAYRCAPSLLRGSAPCEVALGRCWAWSTPRPRTAAPSRPASASSPSGSQRRRPTPWALLPSHPSFSRQSRSRLTVMLWIPWQLGAFLFCCCTAKTTLGLCHGGLGAQQGASRVEEESIMLSPQQAIARTTSRRRPSTRCCWLGWRAGRAWRRSPCSTPA